VIMPSNTLLDPRNLPSEAFRAGLRAAFQGSQVLEDRPARLHAVVGALRSRFFGRSSI
jgi:hypothetical protein